MKMKKSYLLISLILVLSTILAACAAPEAAPAGPVTVDVWFHSGKGEE